MSPSAVVQEAHVGNGIKDRVLTLNQTSATKLIRDPMRTSGLLDKYKHFEHTPIIGREYPHAQISDMMESADRDQYIRDLAITGNSPNYARRRLLLIISSLRTRCRVLPEARRLDRRDAERPGQPPRLTDWSAEGEWSAYPPFDQREAGSWCR
jgi:hypothetical protein